MGSMVELQKQYLRKKFDVMMDEPKEDLAFRYKGVLYDTLPTNFPSFVTDESTIAIFEESLHVFRQNRKILEKSTERMRRLSFLGILVKKYRKQLALKKRRANVLAKKRASVKKRTSSKRKRK